jgi:acetylornithine deacetylase
MKAPPPACVVAARALADAADGTEASDAADRAGAGGAADGAGAGSTADGAGAGDAAEGAGADSDGPGGGQSDDEPEELDGRIVVESVAGEEDGGIGAAAAMQENPYPFERDAAIVAEPTELRPVVATEGCLMARLRLWGRPAHAARRWRGEDVLPRFEAVREAFADLERERCESVTHPLYDEFPVPWPVVCGRVEAGSWASTVPATLTAEFRIGVAPGETVAAVESAFRERLESVAADDPWLREHPPQFERFSVQFEPAEIAVDEPVVEAVRAGLVAAGLPDVEPRGATYGADSRHFVAAGVPAVLFGPGTIDEAHYPDETIAWDEVQRAREAIAVAAVRFANDRAAVV